MTRRRQRSGEPAQGELFKAPTTWFHVLHAMIEDGSFAALGPYAVVVYLVIKAHADFRTGTAFPAVETIAGKAGISRRQVLMSIRVLTERGFLTVERRGRRNHYRLRERVTISDSAGQCAAVASWDYQAMGLGKALDRLKALVADGNFDHGESRGFVIHRFNVNVQINAGSGVQVISIDQEPGRE